MPATMTCPSCSARLKIRDRLLGTERPVRCPRCGNRVVQGSGAANQPTPQPGFTTNHRRIDINPVPTFVEPSTVAAIRTRIERHLYETSQQFINCAGDVIVCDVQRLPVYSLSLDTLYESRRLTRREKPFRGEMLKPFSRTEQNTIAWDLMYPERREFSPSSSQHEIDGSHDVQPCSTCGKRGKVPCPQCDGKGEYLCSLCSGRREVLCSSCVGRGRRHEKRSVQKQVKCFCTGGRSWSGQICGACNGTGWQVRDDYEYYETPCVRCSASGYMRCPSCAGSGIIICVLCEHTGEVCCSRCDGNGSVVSFLALEREFTTDHTSDWYRTPACPEDAVSLLDQERDFRLSRETLQDHIERGEVPDATPQLEQSISHLLSQVRSPNDASERITRQYLRIEEADVYALQYGYQKCAYNAWLSGTTLEVHAPENPVTTHVQQSLEQVMALWSNGDRLEAASLLSQVWQISVASVESRPIVDKFRPSLRFGLRWLACLQYYLDTRGWAWLFVWVLSICGTLALAIVLSVEGSKYLGQQKHPAGIPKGKSSQTERQN